MFGFVNRRLSIGSRLALVAILMIVTTALGLIIPLQRGMDRLQATKAEIAGQHYIGAIWQTLMTGNTDATRDFTALNSALGTDAQYNEFAAATTLPAREVAVNKLIRDVAAASGLMQDPGSSSFHVAEALTRRLPALVAEVDALTAAIAAPASEERKIRIGEALAKLEVDSDRTKAAYDAALSADETGTLAASLREPADAITTSVDKLIAAARGSFEAPSPDYDQARTDFAAALTGSWNASFTTLQSQLEARVTAIWHVTFVDMGWVAGLATLTLLLVWMIAVGLKRRMRKLNQASKKLSRGEMTGEIPYKEDRNETGRLAGTLELIRKEMLRREAEAAKRAADQTAAEKAARAAAESAQHTAEQMVVNSFGAGLKALVAEDLAFRLKVDMPAAYRELQSQFNAAIADLETSRIAREAEARSRDADRDAATAEEIAARETIRQRDIEIATYVFGEGITALAERNLSFRLNYELPDYFEAIQTGFNAAIAELEAAMGDIDQRSSDISNHATDITQAARDMAERTAQQAAALEEATAAITEVSASVHKSAESAREANATALKAQSNARRGNEVAKSTIAAMETIAASSSEITQIIGVIDEIAFQTNLLALNAGVEAARAGDAGRGFAVVAQEVRALAGRSSTAAKQIRALISTSEQQVVSGVKLVQESGDALDKIVADIGTICTLMEQLATAQAEQARALGEVDATMMQMDKGTQANTAMAQESHAASEALATFASDLARVVAQFSLANAGRRRAA
ncbi:MAG: methyl-accepting chemotaxis protein [Rhizomicrobium sp.]